MSEPGLFSSGARELGAQLAFLAAGLLFQVIGLIAMSENMRMAYTRSYTTQPPYEAWLTYVAFVFAGLLGGGILIAGLHRLWLRVRFRYVLPVTVVLYLPMLAVATTSTYLLVVALGVF